MQNFSPLFDDINQSVKFNNQTIIITYVNVTKQQKNKERNLFNKNCVISLQYIIWRFVCLMPRREWFKRTLCATFLKKWEEGSWVEAARKKWHNLPLTFFSRSPFISLTLTSHFHYSSREIYVLILKWKTFSLYSWIYGWIVEFDLDF